MPAERSLDRIDRAILAELQHDGRITNQRLAEKVALSPSACLARVKRLEAAGVIRGYTARVAPSALGLPVTVFAELTLATHDLRRVRAVEAALRAMPEVVEALQVSGSYDYLVRFVVSDMDRWSVLADSLFDGDLPLQKIVTVVMMKEIKSGGMLPMDTGALP